MDDLRNPIARRMRMGRTWRTLTIVLLVLAVALPAAAPVMAKEPCNPRLECEYSNGYVHWTAKGLNKGTWTVVWLGSSGYGRKEFEIGKDCDGHPGCCEYSGSFRHSCGSYYVKLYKGEISMDLLDGKDKDKDKDKYRDKCEGYVECKEKEKEEQGCRTDVSVIIYGGWNGIAVNATVGGSAQPTMYTALDAFGRPAVLWTFYPPAGETWTVVVTPQLPAGFSPEEWKYEPASRTLEIVGCKEYQVTFQLINYKTKVEVILPVTGGEAPGLP